MHAHISYIWVYLLDINTDSQEWVMFFELATHNNFE